MTRSFRKNALAEYDPPAEVRPEDYAPHVGRERVESLKKLAEPLRGKTWVHINSSHDGGGVAEMLRSVIPLARGLGIDARWFCIEGNDAFFGVTKKFHNLLQGVDQLISKEEMYDTYLGTIAENAKKTSIKADTIVVHDPQPLGLVGENVFEGPIVWRCHIDTTVPNKTVWNFIKPFINRCDGAIFTEPRFARNGFKIPLFQITPTIDPCAPKNHYYSDEEALAILDPLLKDTNVDPRRPIIAAVSRYDIHKNQATILEAFKQMMEQYSFREPPYLIFLGNSAVDDPEGAGMLDHLTAMAGDHPDVRFWVNVEDNDRVVGSLMHIARMMVHVSTREGFGLVVSEALWQGTPVIGSCVGGITRQVIDDLSGYAVAPLDVEAIATRMGQLLDNPDLARKLGEQGREHVREHFLLPELLNRHLGVMRFYCGIDTDPPKFCFSKNGYK